MSIEIEVPMFLPLRAFCALCAITSLLLGMVMGLLRMGWEIPVYLLSPTIHGPLLLCGFLGTVISMERAVGARKIWAFLSPFLSALGAAGLLFSFPLPVAQIFFILSSAVLLAIYLSLKAHRSLPLFMMALGALFWMGGNFLWYLGKPIPQVVYWWASFLIFTIAGERRELSKFLNISPRKAILFIGISIWVGAGLLLSLWLPRQGLFTLATGLILLGGWLVQNDVARVTIKRPGITRFMALCILSGYLWLIFGGIVLAFYGSASQAGFHYDALIHSLLLGFVFSMIFAHGPVILPALSGIQLKFTSLFFVPWFLLNLTLALRISGDFLLSSEIRQWGGLGGVVSILLFFATMARAVWLGKKEKKE